MTVFGAIGAIGSLTVTELLDRRPHRHRFGTDKLGFTVSHADIAAFTAAMNAAPNKNSHRGARYRRLAARRGKGKVVVAIQHTVVVTI